MNAKTQVNFDIESWTSGTHQRVENVEMNTKQFDDEYILNNYNAALPMMEASERKTNWVF